MKKYRDTEFIDTLISNDMRQLLFTPEDEDRWPTIAMRWGSVLTGAIEE